VLRPTDSTVRDHGVVTTISTAIPGRLISIFFSVCRIYYILQTETSLYHASWYVQRNRCHYPKVGEPIFRQNRSIHDFDEKMVCTGTNIDGHGGMAEAIRSRQPPEPTMQTATIIHHGRIGLLSFFYLSVDSRRRIFFVLSIHAMDR
jgi:hypothetical protein